MILGFAGPGPRASGMGFQGSCKVAADRLKTSCVGF